MNADPQLGKALVRRLVDEVVNRADDSILDEVADASLAAAARRWIGPFRASFPDFRMEIVDLIGEGDKVVAHFHCSGTQEGEWLGLPPSGRRFSGIDEIYIFTVRNGRLSTAVAVEDNLRRLGQLGVRLPGAS
jgi:predicted ester cyclase